MERQTDTQTDGQTGARGKTIRLPTLAEGDIISLLICSVTVTKDSDKPAQPHRQNDVNNKGADQPAHLHSLM